MEASAARAIRLSAAPQRHEGSGARGGTGQGAVHGYRAERTGESARERGGARESAGEREGGTAPMCPERFSCSSSCSEVRGKFAGDTGVRGAGRAVAYGFGTYAGGAAFERRHGELRRRTQSPAAGPDADAVRRGGGGVGCRARARHRAWGRHLQRERGALPRGRPRRLLRAICAQRKRARALDGARDAVNFPRRCQLSDRARSARDALGALVQRPAPRVHRAPRSESLPVAREEGSALDMQEGRTARGEGVA